MKKVIAVLLTVFMSVGLVACGGSKTYIEVGGEQMKVKEFFELTDMAIEGYNGTTATIVAELTDVNRSAIIQPYGSVDSYIELKADGYNITVDTSGKENVIKDWKPGDLIKVTGKITNTFGRTIYMFTFTPRGNEISVENLGK